jgi:hypothetical protein
MAQVMCVSGFACSCIYGYPDSWSGNLGDCPSLDKVLQWHEDQHLEDVINKKLSCKDECGISKLQPTDKKVGGLPSTRHCEIYADEAQQLRNAWLDIINSPGENNDKCKMLALKYWQDIMSKNSDCKALGLDHWQGSESISGF